MKRLINTSTILSLALYVVPPFAAQAQDLKSVMVGEQQVLCLPNKQTACPDGALCTLAIKAENCQANAEKMIGKEKAKAAATETAPAADPAKVAAEKAAAEQAAADQIAAGKAAADKAASEQALAEKLAADQAKAENAAAKAAKLQATQEKEAAKKAAAEQAAAEKAAADQAAAEKATADKAAADQTATQAATEKAAADQAAAEKAAADKAAGDQAAAEKATADKAATDQAAADQAASDKAAADKTATAKVASDQAAADQAAADKTAADKTATEKAAADQAAADKALADKLAADQGVAAEAQVQADGSAAAGMKVEHPRVMVNGQQVVCLPNKATACPAGEDCVVAKKLDVCQTLAEKKMAGQTVKPEQSPVTPEQAAADAAAAQKAPEDQAAAAKAAADQAAMDKASIEAARKAQKQAERAAAKAAAADPSVKVVEAPVVDKKAEQSLQTVLDAPAGADPTVLAAPVAAAAAAAVAQQGKPGKPSDAPVPKDAKVTEETVTKADTRTSNQDFNAPPVQVAPGKKTGLSDLEKVGLVALGALAIGAIIQGNKQVVANTGDRVVVRQDDGSYQVYKDDSSLMRQPGSDVVTQTYNDGSTRTIFTRPDTSQIVTVRDASGRVLQRIAYDRNGNSTMLIDDLQPERAVDVTRLPQVQPQNTRIQVDSSEAELQAALAAANTDDQGQRFSLRQIRNIPQVRYLAPTIDVPSVTFQTGSAAIQPTEARKLNSLGKFISDLVAKNPGEVFLVEGYTDAVGSAASNLALSDRRAESVAKVLTEYFQVPPENLVVQGFGESDLLIPSAGDEPANRRVAVRIITPLLQQAAN